MRKIIVFLELLGLLLPSFSVAQKTTGKKTRVAYLAAYMKGKDEKHLYYAIARKDFVFEEIHGGKPVLSANFDDSLIRDPMIFRDKKGIYHLVATVSWKNRPFTLWDSKDLVHWKNERLIDVAPENSSKTWAPEIAYDSKGDQYFVYWTAEVNKTWSSASIYYSTTKDFTHFSKPKILFKDTVGILDANLVFANGAYNLFYRKSNSIWVVTSADALGTYGNGYKFSNENVEGPFVFTLRDTSGYGIVFDYYGGSAGFGLMTSPDFKNWVRITNPKAPYYNDKVKFPAGIRHGAVCGITKKELKKLEKAFLK
jgi:hypothetical protein